MTSLVRGFLTDTITIISYYNNRLVISLTYRSLNIQVLKLLCQIFFVDPYRGTKFVFWQFPPWQTHLFKSSKASFWTSVLLIVKIVRQNCLYLTAYIKIAYIYEQIKLVIENLLICNRHKCFKSAANAPWSHAEAQFKVFNYKYYARKNATLSAQKWFIFPCIILKYSKFSNFTGLYFPYFTIFCHQIWQFY
jgi:hypothetical protein